VTISDLELMEIQVETLFSHDGNGRLRYVNEPGGAAAPRFFLGRTKAGNIWRFRHDLPEDVIRRLEAACASEPTPTDLREAPLSLKSLESILQSHREVQRQWMGPAYYFPDGIHYPTNIVRITQGNAALLRPGFTDVIPRLGFSQPCLAVVENGRAVSLCCSVRISSRADEVGVETLRGYRGRGYAASVVAGWAMAVRARGRIPLYSTSWDNVASQRVATKLGLILYGVDLHFT
jgi:hypothetical protein